MSEKRSYNDCDAPNASKRQRKEEIMNKGTESRSGKIKSMRLINFMCHDKFAINFDEHINFIVGNNGSGKSAILTALVVGLGSSAFSTSRGTNIKQFIKKDKHYATIETVIDNSGCDSYKREIFGETITIIRDIRANGSSQYKVKNNCGEVIFKNLENLRKILSFHNIQPDNPVVILNQDNARSFLRTFDPVKSYKLFIRATQLGYVVDLLNECQAMNRTCYYSLKNMERKLNVTKREKEELREKYEIMLSIDASKESLKKCKLEVLWMSVCQQEAIVDIAKNKIDEISKDLNEALKFIVDKDVFEREHIIEIQHLKERISNLYSSANIENREINDLKTFLVDISQRLKMKNIQCRNIESEIVNIGKDIELLKNDIIARRDTDDSRKREQDDLQLQRMRLREEIENTRIAITASERKVEDMSSQFNSEQKNLEQVESQCRKLRLEKDSLQEELTTIRSANNDALLLYGQHMSRFLNSIEMAYKAGHFSKKPIGPIGRYIEVPNEKFRGIIEYLLGSTVKFFIVDSANDRRTMDKILKSEFPGVNQPIVTNRFSDEVYNVENGMVNPPDGSFLAMNEIKCSNPVVVNYLIDRIQIERILLVEDQNLAVQITSDKESIPKNLLKVILHKPRMEYLPLPLYRVYCLNNRQPKFLQINMEYQIMHLTNETNVKQREIQDMEKELAQLARVLQKTNQQFKFERETLDQNRRKLINIQEKLEEIEVEEEDEIKILANELRELEVKFANKKQLFEEMQNECYNCKETIKEKSSEVETKQESLVLKERELKRLITEIDKKTLEFHDRLGKSDFYKQSFDNLKKSLDKEKEDYEKELDTLHKYKEVAEKEGPRIEKIRTKEELDESIRTLSRKISKYADDNIEDVKNQLDVKEKDYEHDIKMVENLRSAVAMMYESLKKRFVFVKELKEQMALRIIYNFEEILKLRNFQGEIDIDHAKRVINISVIPRDAGIQNAVSNTKSLSGGERSFSTAAFLISLWSCIEHPFFFLDEYDVFMDEIYRLTITKLLLHEAKRKPHCQYTFLTPHDVSIIGREEKVNILKIR